MNTPILFSTYSYVAIGLFESAWVTLLKLDRQARRDVFKVSCFVRTLYQFLSSPEMIYKYRRFAEMCSRIAEILWLLVLLILSMAAHRIEQANIVLQGTSQMSSKQAFADPQPVAKTIPIGYSSANAMSDSMSVADNGFSKSSEPLPNATQCNGQPNKKSTIRELKKLAAAAKIPNYGSLTKAQLQAALQRSQALKSPLR